LFDLRVIENEPEGHDDHIPRPRVPNDVSTLSTNWHYQRVVGGIIRVILPVVLLQKSVKEHDVSKDISQYKKEIEEQIRIIARILERIAEGNLSVEDKELEGHLAEIRKAIERMRQNLVEIVRDVKNATSVARAHKIHL